MKGLVWDADGEIARFQADFEALGRNLDRGILISLTEGLSGIREDVYDIKSSLRGIEIKGMLLLNVLSE